MKEDKEKRQNGLSGEDFFVYGSDVSETFDYQKWRPFLYGLAIIVLTLFLAVVWAIN